MNKPLVSIMIIAYNQENFIEEAVISAVMQSYENVEIVVSDDASTDKSSEVLKKITEKYSEKNIIVNINDKNLGITGNCNKAISLCTGEYVAFLGGDDIYLPNKIENQINWFTNNKDKIMCYHDVEVFNSDDNKHLYNFSDRHDMKKGGLSNFIKYGTFASATSIMVKREYIPENGFNENVKIFSDWLFFMECVNVSQNETIGYIEGIHARYRRHGNNITNNANISQAYDEVIYSLDHIGEVAVDNKIKKLIKEKKIQVEIKFSVKYIANKRAVGFKMLIRNLLKLFIYPKVIFNLVDELKKVLKSKMKV